MQLRFIFLWSVAATAACSSSDFSVSEASDANSANDSAVTEDTGTIEPPEGGQCTAIDHASTTVVVDAAAPSGGKGSSGCPFRTLTEAANASLGSGVNRVVWVRTGTYVEMTTIRIRTGETYRSDGSGLVKVSSNATTSCASGETCAFQLAGGATLDGILVEGGSAANGIVASGATGAAPVIRNTTVKAVPKDGIVVVGNGASLGPNTHADANGWSGMMIRNGSVSVNGVGNTFNGNKGGFYSGTTYIAGSGIHVRGGSNLSVDGGTSANSNANGVFFDAGGSSGTQTISQLTAMSNRSIGVHVPKGWQVVLRKSYLNKNGSYGLLVSYDASTLVDLGAVGSPGGNTFGTASTRNGRAGIFLCRSGRTATQTAEGNTWTACPPTQASVANCDTLPPAYVDVAFVPEIADIAYFNPIAAPVTCGTS